MTQGTGRNAGLVDRRSLLVMLAALGASPALAQSDGRLSRRVGAVETLEGTAFARRLALHQLNQGSRIYLNDDIRTGDASRLALSIIGGNMVHLGPNARLTVDRFLTEAGGELVLSNGSMVFDRSETSPKADIEVRTVFGLIGLRGTRFFAGRSRGSFSVFVERGAVVVTAADVRRVVGAGQGVDIPAPGDPPGAVRVWGRARINEALASVLG